MVCPYTVVICLVPSWIPNLQCYISDSHVLSWARQPIRLGTINWILGWTWAWQCDVHLDTFGPDRNDPSARFEHIRSDYESFNTISEACKLLVEFFLSGSRWWGFLLSLYHPSWCLLTGVAFRQCNPLTISGIEKICCCRLFHPAQDSCQVLNEHDAVCWTVVNVKVRWTDSNTFKHCWVQYYAMRLQSCDSCWHWQKETVSYFGQRIRNHDFLIVHTTKDCCIAVG